MKAKGITHSSSVIFVLLRMAASAVAPMSPIPVLKSLCASKGQRVRDQARVKGLTQNPARLGLKRWR